MMTDLLLTEQYDLHIANGDLLTGESTLQHQQLLLLTHKGEWKQYPTAGAGIADYLLDENPADMLSAVRTEFISDGMQVQSLQWQNGKLMIDAQYAS
jgi:hypothetical protein